MESQLSLGPTCGMYGWTSPMRLGPKNIVQNFLIKIISVRISVMKFPQEIQQLYDSDRRRHGRRIKDLPAGVHSVG
jgi:hypothetical protein